MSISVETLALARKYTDTKAPTEQWVKDAADEWLEENVDPATGYVLDRSLTLNNAAAPADLVGDVKRYFILFDDIPGSTQTVNFGSDGKPSSIVYTVGGVAARTDTFTWGIGTVTETRTLADGKHISFTTDLITLVTTISDIEEAS